MGPDKEICVLKLNEYNRLDVSLVNGVQSIVEILKGEDVSACRDALFILTKVLHDDMKQRQLRELGGVELVLDLLDGDNRDMQRHALRVLCQLSMDEQNAEFLRTLEGIAPILDCLQSVDSEIVRGALRTLCNLSANDVNKQEIRELSGLESIVDCMVSEHTGIRRDALRALCNLSVNGDNNIELCELGAVEIILDCIRSAVKSPDLDTCRYGLATLINISANYSNRDVHSREAVETIMLSLSLNDPSATLFALRTLCNTSMSGEGISNMNDAAYIQTIMNCLSPSNRESSFYSLAILTNLLPFNTHVKSEAQQAFDVLLELSRSSEADIRVRAASLLAAIPMNADEHQKVKDVGFYDSALKLLTTGRSRQELVAGLQFIANVSTHEIVGDDEKVSAALKGVLKCAKNPDPVVRADCYQTLVSISSNRTLKEKIKSFEVPNDAPEKDAIEMLLSDSEEAKDKLLLVSTEAIKQYEAEKLELGSPKPEDVIEGRRRRRQMSSRHETRGASDREDEETRRINEESAANQAAMEQSELVELRALLDDVGQMCRSDVSASELKVNHPLGQKLLGKLSEVTAQASHGARLESEIRDLCMDSTTRPSTDAGILIKAKLNGLEKHAVSGGDPEVMEGKISEVHKELERCQVMLQRQTQKLHSAEKQLVQYRTEINNIDEENASLHRTIRALKDSQMASTGGLGSGQASSQKYQEAVSKFTEELTLHATKNKTLHDYIETQNNQVNELINELAEKDSQRSLVEQEVEKKNAELAHCQGELQEALARIADLYSQKDSAEHESRLALQREGDGVRLMRELQHELAVAEAKEEQAKNHQFSEKRIKELEVIIADIKKVSEEHRSSALALKSEVRSLDTQVKGYEHEIRTKDEQMERWRQDLNRLKQEYRHALEREASATDSVRQLKGELELYEKHGFTKARKQEDNASVVKNSAYPELDWLLHYKRKNDESKENAPLVDGHRSKVIPLMANLDHDLAVLREANAELKQDAHAIRGIVPVPPSKPKNQENKLPQAIADRKAVIKAKSEESKVRKELGDAVNLDRVYRGRRGMDSVQASPHLLRVPPDGSAQRTTPNRQPNTSASYDNLGNSGDYGVIDPTSNFLSSILHPSSQQGY